MVGFVVSDAVTMPDSSPLNNRAQFGYPLTKQS